MTAWYKEPNYDGSGITKQIDLKKGAGAMVGPVADFANQSGITEGLKPTGKALGGAVNRVTEPVATGLSEGIKYSPIGVGGNAQRILTNPRSMLPQGMGKKMEKGQGGYDDKTPIQQDVIPPLKPKIPKKLGGYTGFNRPKNRPLPTDAMTMTNKALVKSIDTFLMRKGILQKTANKSSLPLGTYQKAGEPVKRMVNNSATIQSPDVWSAGKKTTKTKE